MHARGIFTTIAFKKLTPLSLFFITIFIFITTLFVAIPRFVLAQIPAEHTVSEHALDNFPFAFEHKEATLQHEAYEVEMPGELLVKFRRGIGREMRQAALARVASRVEHFQDRNSGPKGRRGPVIFDQLVHVKLKSEMTPEAAIADLGRNPNVEYAEPNFVVSTMESFPNDPDFDLLWGLNNIGQTGGTDVRTLMPQQHGTPAPAVQRSLWP